VKATFNFFLIDWVMQTTKRFSALVHEKGYHRYERKNEKSIPRVKFLLSNTRPGVLEFCLSTQYEWGMTDLRDRRIRN
jgi:hypothetical protein